MFLGAFRNASEAKALINKRDNLNLIVFLIALGAQTVVLVGLSFTPYFIWGIPLGLLIAELVVVLGLGFGLKRFAFFSERLGFVVKLLPPLLIALALKLVFGESLITLGVSLVIYILWSFIFFRKLIFGSLTDLS